MTAMLAVIGDEEEAGYDTVSVKVTVDPETGKNFFTPDENSGRRFVVKKFPDEYYANMINKVIE
jgi:hypothetical protein